MILQQISQHHQSQQQNAAKQLQQQYQFVQQPIGGVIQSQQPQMYQHQQLKQHHSSSTTASDVLNESSGSSNDGAGANGSGMSGERPFKCSQCFKTFRKKVHLNQHGRIHVSRLRLFGNYEFNYGFIELKKIRRTLVF